MSDFTNYNYNNTPDEVQNYDNLQTNQNQNFQNIKNIEELLHKNITTTIKSILYFC